MIRYNKEYSRIKQKYTIILFIFIALFIPAHTQAEYSRPSYSAIQTTSAKYSDTNHKASNLLKESDDEFYYSGDLKLKTAEGYISATLKDDDGFDENDTDDLVVYLRRTPNSDIATVNQAQPTEFAVTITYKDADGKTKTSPDPVFSVYFLYRGPVTDEFSTRIPIKSIFDHYSQAKGCKITKLTFYPRATNLDSYFDSRSNGFRDMAFTRFDVLKLSRDQNYSDTFKDGLHLVSDYNHDVKDYKFTNTTGIADNRNSINDWDVPTPADTVRLAELDIHLPKFDFMTSDDSPYPLDSDQKRQRTHTVEHILYAMPGDVIPLIPYYLLPDSTYTASRYQVNFSHWYDYKTGGLGNLDYEAPWSGEKFRLLDFLHDPSKIQVSDSHGFFGGPFMNMTEFHIKSEQDYINTVNDINKKNLQNVAIYIEKNLNFDGMEVPKISDHWQKAFNGYVNGNGHTISHLVIESPEASVGMLGYMRNGIVENIRFDSTCKFVGSYNVGAVVGTVYEGNVTIRNIHTEATVYGTRQDGEQTAAGIIGSCDGTNAKRLLTIENCYIGGEIGNPDDPEVRNNAAVIAGISPAESNTAVFRNIFVNCKLKSYFKGSKYRKFVRYHGYDLPPAHYDENNIPSRWNFSYENCYSTIDTEDDVCWKDFDKAKPCIDYSSWKDSRTPFMEDTDKSAGYTNKFSVSTGAEYVEAVRQININNYTDVYLELTADIDLSYYDGMDDEKTVPMIFEGAEWGDYANRRLHLNGRSHKISNLYISRSETERKEIVGVIQGCGKNSTIENVIFDSSCVIEGTQKVGLIGAYRYKTLTIRNVRTEINFRNPSGTNNYNTAALIGVYANEGENCIFNFENLYIGGSIDQVWHGCGTLFATGYFYLSEMTGTFKNVIVEVEQNARSDFKDQRSLINPCPAANFSITNSFFKSAYDGEILPRANYQLPDIFASWGDSMNPPSSGSKSFEDIYEYVHGDYVPGTSATFYMPKDPFNTDDPGLQFPEGEDEYIIAADFSQTFKAKNLNIKDKEIIEPIISNRQIFRIRNAKDFADDMADPESNRNYMRVNRKFVSARAGAPFQIALDSPVTNDNNHSCQSRANYYYKADNGNYERVYAFGIQVTDGDTHQDVPSSTIEFKFGQEVTSQGIRYIDGVKYAVGDGDDKMNRMLMCDNPAEGHFLVKVIAKDDAGNVVYVYGTSEPLVLMEYDMRFLPVKGAYMATLEEALKEEGVLYEARVALLGEKQSQPKSTITFDEFAKIRTECPELYSKMVYKEAEIGSAGTPAGLMEHSYYKWPLQWDISDYVFGYDNRHDYNTYMLASHSSAVPWEAGAKNYTGNHSTHGTGLYDITYYKSLYRHKEDETRKIKQGFYYMVNASADPGVTAKLSVDELCQGSTIVVSAWMSEFSTASETANLSFNFVAVMPDAIETSHPETGLKNGQRLVVHKFITGYVPSGDGYWDNHGVVHTSDGTALKEDQRGKWLNVFYSFVPRLAEFSSVGLQADWIDHFELELDNNNKNSDGADYAIDEIQCWVVPPTVKAMQLNPLCPEEVLMCRVESPFETLLEIAHSPEATGADESEPFDVYYTYIDEAQYKSKKNELDALGDPDAHSKAFNSAVVEFDYNRHFEEGEEDDYEAKVKFGKFTFYSKYSENVVYPGISMIVDNKNNENADWGVEFGKGYSLTDESQKRLITLVTQFPKKTINGEKKYIVLFRSPVDEDDLPGDDPANYFDLNAPCANKCVTTVTGAYVQKIDGTIVTDKDGILVCANQNPVIQISVIGTRADNNGNEEFEQADDEFFDWYYGPTVEFENYHEEGNEKHKLEEALLALRSKEIYKHKADMNGVVPEPQPIPGQEYWLQQWMIDLIEKASEPDENGFAKLTLYVNSYDLPKYTETDPDAERRHVVTVIPIDCVHSKEDGDWIMCSDKTEIAVKVSGRPGPVIKHGLSDIPYPEGLVDVPLRIGIDQLYDFYSQDMMPKRSPKKIEIPIYHATAGKDDIQNLVSRAIMKDGIMREGCIELVGSDDPQYLHLSETNENGESIGLKWVGEVLRLNARTTPEGNVPGNFFDVSFREDFAFKEGYYYKFRFSYAEEESENPQPIPGDDDDEEDDENVDSKEKNLVCDGQDTFTLKIVPKYLKWEPTNQSGSDDRNVNWNNDANWVRVSSDDMYMTNSRKRSSAMHSHLTDGELYISGVTYDDFTSDRRENVYAPLDFTSVIIPGNEVPPYLYAPATESKSGFDNWPADMTPPAGSGGIGTYVSVNGKNYYDWPVAGIGKATPLIQFDMAAKTSTKDGIDVDCRPWYANTCDNVHFKVVPTAEDFSKQPSLMNQHCLIYNKASVDIELTPSRWYLLSSPLKQAFAGDFYLRNPQKSSVSANYLNDPIGAWQNTELFADIEFRNMIFDGGISLGVGETYDRFKPAVFQRGWDKASAMVFQKDGTSRDVAVKTVWSHVYNDVEVEYGQNAFSIKVDVNEAPDYKAHGFGEAVMLRLPKADTSFKYYAKDGSSGTEKSVPRTSDSYRLKDHSGTLTSSTATSGCYFLVGNPLMTYFDIKKFLEKNAAKLEQKYWLVTDKGLITGSIGAEGSIIAQPSNPDDDDVTDPTVIAPMQGFFVMTKEAATSVELDYNESMMRRHSQSGDVLNQLVRSDESPALIRVSAYSGGRPSSAAVLALESETGRDSIDVMAVDHRGLDIPATVYTLKNGKALSINRTDSIEGTEIGVIANDGTATTLIFDGVEGLEHLYLLDKWENTLIPLSEGLDYTVKGPASGRLFLTSDAPDTPAASELAWYLSKNVLTVTDPARTGHLEVKVFDTLGRLVDAVTTSDPRIEMTIPQGVFAISISNSSEHISSMIKVN